MFAVVAMVASLQAESVNRIINANTALTAEINKYEDLGYRLQRDLTEYQVYDSPFLYSSGKVTMTDENGSTVVISFNVNINRDNSLVVIITRVDII